VRTNGLVVERRDVALLGGLAAREVAGELVVLHGADDLVGGAACAAGAGGQQAAAHAGGDGAQALDLLELVAEALAQQIRGELGLLARVDRDIE